MLRDFKVFLDVGKMLLVLIVVFVAIKEDMQVLMNYIHEVLLLNIDRKLIEKVLYDPLCCNFLRFPLQKAERIRMWKASSF